MNRGLLAKAWRESWPITLLCGLGLLIVESAEAYALLKFQAQISTAMSQIVFVQKMVRAFLGANVAEQLGPEMFTAIPWAHPVALALLWAHAIACGTRVPAGEVDRGTIDVLLGLPVSRWGLYACESLVWLASGVVVLLMWVAGNALGTFLASGPQLDPGRLIILALNLLCLYAAVGGLTWLVCASSDRRGRAVGVVLAFVLGSFLLNFLGPFWSLADRLSFLSLLHYYVPLRILQAGSWPLRNLTVLGAFAVTLWTMGGIIFSRRDLSTL